jgi:hypothetical protein
MRNIVRRPLSAADLDGDGDQDVLAAATSDDKIAYWYENTGAWNLLDRSGSSYTDASVARERVLAE